MRIEPAGFSPKLLANPHGIAPVVSSWRGGQLLAENIPVLSGDLQVRVDQRTPERLTLTVPARDPKTSTTWAPRVFTDPLAHYGQRLLVQYGIVTGTRLLLIQLGWFQIVSWDADDYEVQVEALGLLNVVDEDRLVTPTQPSASATLKGEAPRLMAGNLPLFIDPALTDRGAPQAMVWDEDRLGALFDIANAWPARLRVDSSGTARLLPPLPATPTPVLSFVDGKSGTVITSPRSGSRDNVYNAVVARGSDTDDPDRPPVQQVAYDLAPGSPTEWGTFGHRPRFYQSPQLETDAIAAASAVSLLNKSKRVSRPRIVRCAPDPRIEADDPVASTYKGETVTGYVNAYTLPLTASGGDMTLEIATVGGTL